MVFPLSPPIRRSIWCLLNIVENITLYFCHHLWEKNDRKRTGQEEQKVERTQGFKEKSLIVFYERRNKERNKFKTCIGKRP